MVKRRVECVVAAPSKIPRASGNRVKTDRRDAELLARLLLAGKLHAVRVSGPEEEALRDLVCAREQVRVDLMRCRHRLSKLLLRHGIRFDDGDAWTDRHRQWLNEIVLEWPAAQATLLDVRGAIDALTHRRDGLERQIVSMVPNSPWRSQVGVLRCLRGIDTLTAVGLCAEVGVPAAGVVPAADMSTSCDTPGGSRAPVGAAVLIILGVLFLLDNLGIFEFHWVGRMWPLILVVIGGWLFYKRWNR